MTAYEEIEERERRLRNVPADLAQAAWLRELTNEITRLRYAIEAKAGAPTQPVAGPQKAP